MTSLLSEGQARRSLGNEHLVLGWRDATAAFLVYSLLSLVVTWPLAASLRELGVPNPDYYGNTWVLSWVVHQAWADPLHLFDANIFYPSKTSLAYNESLLPQALMAAPILLWGGSPVLAHNVMFLLTFPLSGLGAYLLARELWGERSGAFLAGLGFAFCAYRFRHLNHLQSVSLQWLPLVVLFLLRSLRDGGRWNLTCLCGTALAQALSCAYFGLLLIPTLCLTFLHGLRQKPGLPRLVAAAMALALAGSLALLVFQPYRALQRRQGLHRSRAECIHWSARPGSYLDPGEYVVLPHHRFLRGRFASGDPLYPGAAVLLLAAVGLVRSRGVPGTGLCALLAVTGILLSLGPEIRLGSIAVPGLFELLRLVPGGSLIRTPGRLGVLALLGFDLLAALGWAVLLRRHPRLRVGFALVSTLMLVEAFPADLYGAFGPIPQPSPASRWLAGAPNGPVLELPWNAPEESALYVYWSTVHWQPLVNGWGSYEPPGNFGLGLLGRRWPSPYTAAVFRRYGIAYVVVHLDRVSPRQRDQIVGPHALPAGVTVAADLGGDRVFAIAPE